MNMIVKIISSKHENLWYHNKILQSFDVVDTDDKDMYFLSKKALKSLKKARHLQIGILREDCEVEEE